MNQLKGIGLGTFPFAGVFGAIDGSRVSEIIKTYIENQGEMIHTSVVYGAGKVEEMLGNELAKYKRDDYVIKSCCGWAEKEGGYVLSGKKGDVIKCTEDSLKRLKLDYVDVLMSHAPDVSTPFIETIEAMNGLKQQGKAKSLCVSNVSLEQLKEYNYNGSIEYVQNRFSLLNQSMNQEFFNYCAENKIKVVTYQSVERGLLTDKVVKGIVLNEGDLRNKKPEFKDEISREIGEWVIKELLPIANALGISITTLVTKWTLANQNVDISMCGISKIEYFKDYLDVNKIDMDEDCLTKLNKAYDEFVKYVNKQYNKTVVEFMGLV